MSKPTFPPIDQGQAGWQAQFNQSVDAMFNAPRPLFLLTGDESTLEGQFPAAAYDECWVWVTHSVLGKTLYISEGAVWGIASAKEKQSVASYTAAGAISAVDRIVEATGTGPYTLTLPAASSMAGRRLDIKNTSTGIVTVQANGAETIDGANTFVLTTLYSSITIISNGTAWLIL